MNRLSDEDILREIADLNTHPANVRAREFLLSSGTAPDPRQLHMVQLANQVLAAGLINPDPAVAETIRAMATWTPQRLYNFFHCEGGERDILPPQWGEASSLVDFAQIVVDETEERVFAFFPCYLSGD